MLKYINIFHASGACYSFTKAYVHRFFMFMCHDQNHFGWNLMRKVVGYPIIISRMYYLSYYIDVTLNSKKSDVSTPAWMGAKKNMSTFHDCNMFSNKVGSMF